MSQYNNEQKIQWALGRVQSLVEIKDINDILKRYYTITRATLLASKCGNEDSSFNDSLSQNENLSSFNQDSYTFDNLLMTF